MIIHTHLPLKNNNKSSPFNIIMLSLYCRVNFIADTIVCVTIYIYVLRLLRRLRSHRASPCSSCYMYHCPMFSSQDFRFDVSFFIINRRNCQEWKQILYADTMYMEYYIFYSSGISRNMHFTPFLALASRLQLYK